MVRDERCPERHHGASDSYAQIHTPRPRPLGSAFTREDLSFGDRNTRNSIPPPAFRVLTMTAPVATKLPPPGASAFPHLSPRPAYGPAWPYVLRAFCRILRFPLLCTAFHVWTEPGYAHAYSLFT